MKINSINRQNERSENLTENVEPKSNHRLNESVAYNLERISDCLDLPESLEDEEHNVSKLTMLVLQRIHASTETILELQSALYDMNMEYKGAYQIVQVLHRHPNRSKQIKMKKILT